MTLASTNIGSLIVIDPALRGGGRPCLAGTGMTVHAVAALHEQGLRAEEIPAEFDDLDLSLIHAALAFYLINRAQIEADWASDAELEGKLTAAHPDGWPFPSSG